MITAIVIVDLVLIGLIALWVAWVNITGDTDQRSGAGLAAFMMISLIAFWSAVVVIVGLIINLIWS